MRSLGITGDITLEGKIVPTENVILLIDVDMHLDYNDMMYPESLT